METSFLRIHLDQVLDQAQVLLEEEDQVPVQAQDGGLDQGQSQGQVLVQVVLQEEALQQAVQILAIDLELPQLMVPNSMEYRLV